MALWKESHELARQREAKEEAAAAARRGAAAAGGQAAAAAAAADGAEPAALAAAREGLLRLQRWQRRVALFHHLRVKCGAPHPAWFLANNLAQWPVFIYLGLSVRSMAQRLPPWPGLDTGGALWFPDLTLPAVAAAAGGGLVLPMGAAGLALPLAVTGMMLASIRLGFKASGGRSDGAGEGKEAGPAPAPPSSGVGRPTSKARFQHGSRRATQLEPTPLPLAAAAAAAPPRPAPPRPAPPRPGAASRHPSVAGTFLAPLLRYAPAALYSLTLVSLYLKIHLPQAVLLHWAASSGFTLGLQLALRRPRLRAALGFGGPAAPPGGGAAGGAVDPAVAARAAAAGSADVLVAMAARESALHRYAEAAYYLGQAAALEPANAGCAGRHAGALGAPAGPARGGAAGPGRALVSGPLGA
jgi:hypothetical protein